jgi:hypothetical protein
MLYHASGMSKLIKRYSEDDLTMYDCATGAVLPLTPALVFVVALPSTGLRTA